MTNLQSLSTDQIDQLISMLTRESEARSVSTPDPKTVELQCIGTTKAGSQCKRSAVPGTTRCHMHPLGEARESEPTLETVAANTGKSVRIGQAFGKARVTLLHEAMLLGACEMDYHGTTAKKIRAGLTAKGWKFTWTGTNTFTATHASAAHTLTGHFGKRTRKSPTAKREFVIA